MAFTWRYLRADGTDVVDLPEAATSQSFPSQSEAESWVGETWRDLLNGGVDAVALVDGDVPVYGPMSLHPTQ